MAEMCRPSVALCDHRLTEDLAKAAIHGPGDGGVRLDRLRRPDHPVGGQVGRVRRRRHRRRRRRPARVHLGDHRPAQGDHALPPRRAGDRRHLLGARAAPGAGRRLHRLPADRVHLRPRRPGGVPTPRGRERAAAGEGDAGPAGGRGRETRGHGRVHRADRLQGDPRRRRRRQARRRPPRRLRGRGPAGVGVAGRARGHRTADHRRHRRDRDAAHLHLVRRRRHPPRLDRPRGARLHRRRPRRRRAARCPTAPPAASPSAVPPAAATSAGTGRRSTSARAGTSPATPTSATPTATSTTRRAPTT